jgi:hypothetical protein
LKVERRRLTTEVAENPEKERKEAARRGPGIDLRDVESKPAPLKTKGAAPNCRCEFIVREHF